MFQRPAVVVVVEIKMLLALAMLREVSEDSSRRGLETCSFVDKNGPPSAKKRPSAKLPDASRNSQEPPVSNVSNLEKRMKLNKRNHTGAQVGGNE